MDIFEVTGNETHINERAIQLSRISPRCSYRYLYAPSIHACIKINITIRTTVILDKIFSNSSSTMKRLPSYYIYIIAHNYYDNIATYHCNSSQHQFNNPLGDCLNYIETRAHERLGVKFSRPVVPSSTFVGHLVQLYRDLSEL